MSYPTKAESRGLSWIKDVTGYQWMVFLIAWAGWMLDATDFGLFNLVLRPAITELLGGNPTIAQIGQVGGFLSMAGLLGWALGLRLRYQQRLHWPHRTLILSVADLVFTGLQGLACLDARVFRFCRRRHRAGSWWDSLVARPSYRTACKVLGTR